MSNLSVFARLGAISSIERTFSFAHLCPLFLSVLADRQGITSELDLLVADFLLLEEQLSALAQALDSEDGSGIGTATWSVEDGGSGRPSSTAALATSVANLAKESAARATAAGGGDPLGIIGEDVLEKLAIEIPDMRVRVGVADQVCNSSHAIVVQ